MKQNSELTRKEIMLQPESFQGIQDSVNKILATIVKVFQTQWDELIFTGCGTSLYLAQTAAAAFASCNSIPAKSVPCSELYFFPETYVGKGKKVLVLPITRKSYTTEVRMAIDKIRGFDGVETLAITCDRDSSLYNDAMILSPDTAEDSVIMTRSFTSMVYLATILALGAAGKREEITAMMHGYVDMSREMLADADLTAKRIMEEHSHLNLFITLGQGVNYGIANECMNKMKEMGLANSEAYYSLEYRHGPMSLVDEHTFIILLANDACIEYDKKLMEQMKSYGAVTLIVGENVKERFQGFDYYLDYQYGKTTLEYSSVIGFVGQLLGYYIAEQKKLDADTPRHLTQAIVLSEEK